jgi:pimeloyl-[acyl-carrier protein] methyl ester esterase
MDLPAVSAHAPNLFSFGDSCAIEVAVAAPERVAALVLIGTKADHRPEPDLYAAAVQTLRERGIGEAWETYWAPLFSRSAGPRVVAQAKEMALGQSVEAITRGVTAFHTRPSRGGFLKTVRCPVIVVTGANDISPGPITCAAQADAAPHGRLHVIPDCGHYVPLERRECLNTILRGVIAEQEC